MPTSATGISIRLSAAARRVLCPARVRGFSLIELLVVVAIVGVFLGVAVLSTDLVSFERKLQREADRLAVKIRFTSEEALMQSRDFGIVFHDEGYQFMAFEPGQGWLEAGGAGMEAVDLEPDMAMRLYIDDREVVLLPRCEVFDCGPGSPGASADDEDEAGGADADSDEGPDLPTPQIVIYSSGEATPFELEFLRESEIMDPGYQLTVEFDSQTEVTRGAI